MALNESDELEEASRLLALRPITDHRIDTALVWTGVSSWILWATYLTEVWFGLFSAITGIERSTLRPIFSLTALLATVPLAYLIYKIVNRRNEHFGRSEAFLKAVVGKLAITSPTEPIRAYALSNAEKDLLGLSIGQKERSGYLLSLLVLVPLALVSFFGAFFVFAGWFFFLYALYRVSVDFVQHEPSEFLIFEEVQHGLGLPPSQFHVQPRRWYPSRNSLAYFLLSILTLGVFALFWLYVEIQDPDLHFQVQSHLETQIQSLLVK